MTNWLRKLFGIHIHEYGMWEHETTYVSKSYGVKKIIQKRKCKTCGYMEYNTQEAGW